MANLKDNFHSTEKLYRIMGTVDGITIASVLAAIADEIDL